MKKVIFMALCLLGTAGAQAQQQVQKWEYATYYEAMAGGKYFFGWQVGDKQDSYSSRRELLNALKCPNSADFTNNVMLFDCMGQQGWEFVQVDAGNVPRSDSLNYYFKRPAR